ncbi:hypothetical protein Fcan01_19280 [Folsomia candida]|uniref:DUF659 domain-containing protein n=1 Tax=Folsomia candida TaxID=158441 RepID=A0A226DMH3_FOLCA|nr:hypothetical protein Fcan01_19280 [Folsomia candida]
MKTADRIWLEWKVVGDKATCRHCNHKTITKHATRCKEHMSTCSSAPPAFRQKYVADLTDLKLRQTSLRPVTLAVQKMDDSNQELELVEEICVNADELSTTIPSTTTAKRHHSSFSQSRLLSINAISKLKMKELQTIRVNAMINGNIPFNWLQDPVLNSFFQKLGSGFVMPSPQQASTSILSALNKDALTCVNDAISNNRHLSIIIDGWKNCRGVPVINIILANPSSCIFYKSYEPGANRETGEYLASVIKGVIEEVQATHGQGKIVAIVTDQGSNFVRARRVISNEETILSINCGAHMPNLLAEDISKIPSINRFLKKSTNVVKEIKKSKLKLARYYDEYQKWIDDERVKGNTPKSRVTLTLPSKSRWYGIRDMFHKLLRARPVLERLSILHEIDFTSSTRMALKDDSFWTKLEHVAPLFRAISDVIAITEGNSCTLSDVVEEFEKLRGIFEQNGDNSDILKNATNISEIKKCQTIFKNRTDIHKLTKIHYLANFLDPRYRGQKFVEDEEKLLMTLSELEDYAKNIGVIPTEEAKEELGRQISSYRRKEGIFGNSMLLHRTTTVEQIMRIKWNNQQRYPKKLKKAVTSLVIEPHQQEDVASDSESDDNSDMEIAEPYSESELDT